MAINLWQSWDIVKTYARMYDNLHLRDGGTVWNMYKMNSYIPLNYVVDTAGVVVGCMEGFNEYTIRSWIESSLPPVGVSEGTRLELGLAATAFPNPAAGPATIRFSVPGNASAAVRVYSATGALVRSWESATGSVRWDLADGTGQPVENGLYFAEVSSGPNLSRTKLSVLR